MKIIHLNESKLDLLFEDNNKMAFNDFYDNVLDFIKKLIKDPINAQPSDLLKSYGLTNAELRKKLSDYGVVEKKEDIREPYDETSGKKESRYYVSYKVLTKTLRNRLIKLGNDLPFVINHGNSENKNN